MIEVVNDEWAADVVSRIDSVIKEWNASHDPKSEADAAKMIVGWGAEDAEREQEIARLDAWDQVQLGLLNITHNGFRDDQPATWSHDYYLRINPPNATSAKL